MGLTLLCVINRQQFREKRRMTEHERLGVSEMPHGTPLGASAQTAAVAGRLGAEDAVLLAGEELRNMAA